MTTNIPYNPGNTQGIPFNAPNHRISYYCQAVFVWEKNGEEPDQYPYDPTLNSYFLKGVQAVGTSSNLNPESLSDVGRFQKQAIRYGETEYEINIERILDFDSEMFYRVYGEEDPSGYDSQYSNDYKDNHILNKKNMGSKGYPTQEGSENFALRSYDITILYTPDRFSRIANAIERPEFSGSPEEYLPESSDNLDTGEKPNLISNPFRHQDYQPAGGIVEDTGIDPLAGTQGSLEDNDRYDVISMTYRNCLISSISYSINADGAVTESITLNSKNLVHNINSVSRDPKDIRYYNLPNKQFFSVQLPYRYPDNPLYLWKEIDQDPLSLTFKEVIGTQYSESSPGLGWYRVKAKPRQGLPVRRYHLDILRDSYGPSNLPTEVINLFDLEVAYESEIGSEYTDRTERRKNLAITSINIDLSFNYKDFADIGKRPGSVRDQENKVNRFKVLSLPIDVKCSFEGITRQGMPYWNFLHEFNNSYRPNQEDFDAIRNVDNVYTKSAGSRDYNDIDFNHLPDWMQADREIKLVARGIHDEQEKFLLWDLGKRNYLVDISTSGGDTSGGEVKTTLTYSNSCSDAVFTKGDYVENIIPYDIDNPTEPL